MKNQSIITTFKRGIVTFLIIGTSSMIMSLKTITPNANTYEIVSSQIFFEVLKKLTTGI